jgi:hypothetical protein
MLLKLMALVLLLTVVPSAPSQDKSPTLKIVQDSLAERGNFYYIKGSIYNPYEKGVKNVVIKYHIWKKWMGKDGHGLLIKETGGLVESQLKFLPPKQTVEFTATGGDNAPVMVHDMPDPIEAEISAEWDN